MGGQWWSTPLHPPPPTGRTAEEAYAKGQALAYVMARLRRYWWAGKPQSGPRPFTLGDALKVAPADVVRDVLERLYGAGFGEADGLPPRPEA